MCIDKYVFNKHMIGGEVPEFAPVNLILKNVNINRM